MRSKQIYKRPVYFQALLATVMLCLGVPVFVAQEKKPPKSAENQDEVIKVTSNLVSLDVIVKDKKGKPVTDLKAEDFVVSENGVTQNIEFFDSTLTSGNEPGQRLTTGTQAKPLPPSGLPRNIIALVLDGQTTEASNLTHVREGITKYIRERISDTDSVALFSISAGLQLLQSFTHDKAKLLAAVDKASNSSITSKTAEARTLNQEISSIRDRLSGLPDPNASFAASPSAGAAGSAAAEALIAQHVLEQYMQLRSALSAQQTRPVLAALAAISEGLRPVPGKKTLVMFSEGFVAPESLDWQVQSTIDIANRANVAIYIIDSSGLVGGTPTSGALVAASPLAGISGDNSMESRRRVGGGESVFDITRQEGLNRQQDLLYKISEDTGGRFIKNTNDISVGLDRIHAEIRSRYTLAYRSTDQNFDGSFRKVKVELKRSDLNVVTRQGYYAIPPDQIVPLSPDDRKLLASFTTLANQPTLPLSLALNPFRARDDYYTVPLSFEIPPGAVQFDRKGDKKRLQIEVLGVVRGEGDDKILSRLGGNFDVTLSAEQYEAILNDKIFYRQDMQLGAGNYSIDLMVRDRVSGKAAAKREKLVLPVADTQFSATEVVLSRHAEPAKQPYLASGDVLAAGNMLIRPSPSKEFRATDNLIIFFKLYNGVAAADTGRPIIRVTVLLSKDGKLAIKPLDYQLSDLVVEPIPHLTFSKFIKLAGLSPGKYSLSIESRDMVANKVVKQESWFVIAQ
ncbi:MAG: VWA domain-containing protein [Pyrinomonadaceae bacterium]